MAWLSQYAEEDTIVFPPLCALEVVDTRVEGLHVTVELRPSVPEAMLKEMSIEEMRAERQRELEHERWEAHQVSR